MILRQLLEAIESKYPLEKACEWDNSGLMAGYADKEISRVYVALDPTMEQIEEAVAKKADLLLTHHPLLFHGITSVTDETIEGRSLLALIRNDVCCYSMHTNYDAVKMAELAAKMLGLRGLFYLSEEGIGRVGKLEEEITLGELSARVCRTFDLPEVVLYGDSDRKVSRIAVLPGSGKSMIEDAIEKRADVMITGDINHHAGIDANAMGLALIDAGHYGIEHIFIDDMRKYLESEFSDLVVFTEKTRLPYHIVKAQ